MSAPDAARHPAWFRWLVGWRGIVAATLWGLAEGSLFFVVPDVLFTLVTAFRPRRALAHVAGACAGALVAGALMFAWSARDPDAARAAVASVPKIGAAMVERTDARWSEVGMRALFDRPLGGVPYKVYAVLAPGHTTAPRFLAASVLARLERFSIAWVGFALLHILIARGRPDRWKLVVAIHASVWIAVYAYYWFLA